MKKISGLERLSHEERLRMISLERGKIRGDMREVHRKMNGLEKGNCSYLPFLIIQNPVDIL